MGSRGRERKKQPQISEKVTASKKLPAIPAQRRGGTMQACLRFRFDQLDVGGPYCMTRVTAAEHEELLRFLKSMETMTIGEVFAADGRGKDYEAHKLPSAEAKARLVDIDRDDQDTISRLRVSNLGRLYGFRRDNEFSILWWDPQHKIWPSGKR